MAVYVQIVVTLAIFGIVTSDSSDYFWRDFDGQIPSDALQAGTDNYGPIYIGQVLFNGKLIPGKLYRNNNNIYFEDNMEVRSTSQNVKIFCTKHPENFEWFFTKHTDYKRIKDYELVDGGYDPEYKTLIGREYTNEGHDVGKVLCRESYCLALITSKSEKRKKYYSYSVLVYIPKVNNNVVRK